MVKWINIGFAVMLVFTIAALYHIRYSAESEARALKKIERAIAHEQDVQRTLRAEWSSLNDPRRLQILARDYLDLAQLRPSQILDFRSNATKTIPVTLNSKGSKHEPH